MQIVSRLLIDGVRPVTVGGTGCSLKLFPSVAGTTSSKRGYVYCPGNNQVNGQQLIVRASGNFKTSAPLRIGLYAVVQEGLPFELASDVFSGSGTAPWMLDAKLCGDSGSGVVHGRVEIQSVTATQHQIFPLKDINFSSDEPFALVVGVSFSFSSEKNKASMFQFALSI